MKLRLRSLESKETQKLEVPSPCTLQQLKQILSQAISSTPSSLRFSLNRKDELHASSSDQSLSSLGVTSGDLIYFSLNPNAFGSETLGDTQVSGNIQESGSGLLVVSRDHETQDAKLGKKETPVQESPKSEVNGVNLQEPMSEYCEVSPENRQIAVQETSNVEETQEFCDTETMDIDYGSVDVPGKKMSEPYFLRRVLREELGGGDDANAHKFVVYAVHAVLLESGFVGFDTVSGMKVDRIHLPEGWPSTTSAMSLWYTLPELLNNNSNDSRNVTDSVVFIKFQNLGHFVNVYGSLNNGDSGLHRVCLNRNNFAPIINLVWVNSDKNDKLDDKDENKNSNCENEVFEFWKIVKDGLALPLLIDLCDKTGLTLPACLMRLPTELKLKILEFLSAVDIAKMGCVCSEMQYLAFNNDLWKQKFAEEFGGGSDVQGMTNWKARFVLQWENKKKRKRAITPWRPSAARPIYFPYRRDPNPLGVFPIVGGDYDRLPGLGGHFPFGQPGQGFGRFHRRGFSPNCNLGGI